MASYDELIYDPIGHLFDGSFQRGAYGGHSDHVHVALAKHPRLLLSLLLAARRMGLRVGENPFFDAVDPVHTGGSFHYQNFGRKFRGKTLGKAADVSGSPELMAQFFRLAKRHLLSGNPVGGGGARGGGGGRRGPGQPIVVPQQVYDQTNPTDIFQRLMQPSALAAPGLPNPAQAQSTYLASELQDLRRQLLAT